MSAVLKLARPDLLDLQAYAHAAWDPALERLHANESPWRPEGDQSAEGLNRYPQPYPRELATRLAELYGVPPQCVLAGRGSDEAIDLLVRGFCRAGRDTVAICPPTFGMYAVAARIQGARVVEAPLLRERDFALDEKAILGMIGAEDNLKLLFLCSPNNPTGNLLDTDVIERLCAALEGRTLVVVDEAYIEFADRPGLISRLPRFANLVVLRTLSKAHALAGARCGCLIGDPALVEFLGRLLPPYALPSPTIEAVLRAIGSARATPHLIEARIQTLTAERERLRGAMERLAVVRKVWPSAANFLLVEFTAAEKCLRAGIAAGLLVRDLRRQAGLNEALRITIGTAEQNNRLLQALEGA
jgi:histidinol-phosphate aminotransferase